MLLDQVESSVDSYRRSMRFDGAGLGAGGGGAADAGSARSSYYGGVDNRTSVALDSLASELETLRTHWESNKTYRLSTLDFDGGAAAGPAEHAGQWRQKLAVEEGAAAREERGAQFSSATVAAGGGVI